MTEKKHIFLKGEDALNLWLKGGEAWNGWVNKNPEASVSFEGMDFSKHVKKSDFPEISFEGFIFPSGAVFFNGASFIGRVSFSRCIFNGLVSFNTAKFNKIMDISFDNTVFHSDFEFRHVNIEAYLFITFSNVIFLGEADFSNDRISGGLYFHKTKFKKGISLANGTFDKGRVSFSNVDFGQNDVTFEHSAFNGAVIFLDIKNTEKIKKFSFKYSSFEKSLILPRCRFGCVIDLTDTKLNHSVSLHKLQCDLNLTGGNFYNLKKAKNPEDAARFRRLKEVAVKNKDHDRALHFHRQELRAKRWHELSFLSSIMNVIYSGLSNYGQSAMKPFVGLFFFLIVGIITQFYSSENFDIWAAFNYSLSNILPFLSGAKSTAVDSLKILYPENGNNVPYWLYGITLATQLINYILIFLFGLALRNKFKI